MTKILNEVLSIILKCMRTLGSTVELDLDVGVVSDPKGVSMGELALPLACYAEASAGRYPLPSILSLPQMAAAGQRVGPVGSQKQESSPCPSLAVALEKAGLHLTWAA